MEFLFYYTIELSKLPLVNPSLFRPLIHFSESLLSFVPHILTFPLNPSFLFLFSEFRVTQPLSWFMSLAFTNLYSIPTYFRVSLKNYFPTDLHYRTQAAHSVSQTSQTFFDLHESLSNARFQRAANPIFRYDYKLGNYFTKDDSTKSPYLFTTISEITGGIRKSA